MTSTTQCKPFCKFCLDKQEEFVYQVKGFPVEPIVSINGKNCDLFSHLVCGKITPISKGTWTSGDKRNEN